MLEFLLSPEIWIAFFTLTALELVLGIDNIIFISILVDKLPPAQGRLFLMREWLELSSEDICKELNLTPTNLYVQLHRARLRLRECLELNWFATPKAT